MVPTNPAFERPKTKDTFAPPPRRGNSDGTSPAPVSQAALPAEEEGEEEEEEEAAAQGEWVEALYDLEATVRIFVFTDSMRTFSDAFLGLKEPTDLSFKAGDQIWVTDRPSKDWWMAEVDGKSGLVPATYVKPL